MNVFPLHDLEDDERRLAVKLGGCDPTPGPRRSDAAFAAAVHDAVHARHASPLTRWRWLSAAAVVTAGLALWALVPKAPVASEAAAIDDLFVEAIQIEDEESEAFGGLPDEGLLALRDALDARLAALQ